jgi:hypothetical protein
MSNVIEMLLAPRLKMRDRRRADDWLRSSTGTFIPEKYARRAEELCSLQHRATLAKTLRKIERSAEDRAVGRATILNLGAVRAHRHALRALVRWLEAHDKPVTPAGVLRVVDLITQAGSPLYDTGRSERLGAEIAATIDLLRPRSTERAAA